MPLADPTAQPADYLPNRTDVMTTATSNGGALEAPDTAAGRNAAGHVASIAAAHEAWRWCLAADCGPACLLSRAARAALHEAGWDGCNAESTAEALEGNARESVLSVLVRDAWRALGEPGEPGEPAEFELLLTWGGPALRIVGQLQDGEPWAPRMEVADWGMSWQPWRGAECREALLWFCGLFWFGEG